MGDSIEAMTSRVSMKNWRFLLSDIVAEVDGLWTLFAVLWLDCSGAIIAWKTEHVLPMSVVKPHAPVTSVTVRVTAKPLWIVWIWLILSSLQGLLALSCFTKAEETRHDLV